MSNKYGIHHQTLKNKYCKWNKKKLKNIDDENIGGFNKIFTNEEEYEIFIYLKENYITKNLPLCNEDIKTIATEKHKLLGRNKIKNFNASNGWCSNFKKRWELISVTPKMKNTFFKMHFLKCILYFF